MLKNTSKGLTKFIGLLLTLLLIPVTWLVFTFIWEVLGWWYLAIVLGFALLSGIAMRHDPGEALPPNREDSDVQQT